MKGKSVDLKQSKVMNQSSEAKNQLKRPNSIIAEAYVNRISLSQVLSI